MPSYNVQALVTFSVEADSPEEAAETVEAHGGDLNAVQQVEAIFDENGMEVDY